LKATTTQSHGSSHSSQQHRSSSKGVPSNTAREAALIVEWEPVSELQRRIDEGIHYQHDIDEHVGNPKSKRRNRNGGGAGAGAGAGGNKEDSVDGVFCGYRVTVEEVSRLKSANPDDYSV